MKFWDLFQFGDEPDPKVLNEEIAAIESAARNLLGRRRRLFACDCAERVLSIYEKRFPDDDRPRTAIMEARRAVFGISAELAEAHADVEIAYQEAASQAPEEFEGKWPPVLIAEACWMTSLPDMDEIEAAEICRLILRAVQSTSNQVLKESRWQYKQLQTYLEQGPLIVPPRAPR